MRDTCTAAIAAILLALASTAQAQTTLNLMNFPCGGNLPQLVAEQRGFYAREGLAVTARPAPSSVALVRGLMDGSVDLGLAAFDNVVGYQEGQGEVALDTQPDLFAFMGFCTGMLRLVVEPQIASIADLRGRTLGVDAVATGFSMVLMKLLASGGLNEGDYRLEPAGGTPQRAQALLENRFVGTMLPTPFELLPESRGYRRLADTTEALGPYQSTAGVARRSWAATHRAALLSFIRASVAALDWLRDPANRDEAVAIYMRSQPNAPRALAERAVDSMIGPREGFSPRGRLDQAAMQTVLRLRSEFGRPQRALTDASRYVDESFYAEATAPR
jgi:ABC-type nitrate/sulfonate/bicarbonate transport system substrate-binding protein